MARHTAREWRELVKKLIALRDDVHAPREKRQGAEAILIQIRGNPDAQAALRDEFKVGWDEII